MTGNTYANDIGCGTSAHFNRRTLLMAGAAGLAWLSPVSQILAREKELAPRGAPAKSIILLWLQGGPSQLDTFDPHPGRKIGGEVKAIDTAAKGVRIAESLAGTAEVMDSIALVRNVVSKEGDHERATYNVKTGYRPDQTLVHPSIGAVVCHELPVGKVEIPRHVSILPNIWSSRGGYLGDKYDAFRVPDPLQPIPDVRKTVSDERFDRRLADLELVESTFARGRLRKLDEAKTLHRGTIEAARKMMTSDQLKAFDVSTETQETRERFGDTPFGRGTLAAARLVEVGVRCVEVILDGWDTHINNDELQRGRAEILDKALSALIKELRGRDLLRSTIVICGGEFGRTPSINPTGGRDHWPHGFTIALAGGGLRGGLALGETDPEGSKLEYDDDKNIKIADIHATVLSSLGIEFSKDYDTPIGRPMKVSQGKIIRPLLADA